MSSTHETNAFNAYCASLRRDVLHPICQHLSSKGVQCPVDELAEILKLPAPASTGVPPVSSSAASVPNLNVIAGLNGVVPAAAGSGKRGRGKKSPVTEEEQCIYIMIRGKIPNSRCTARKMEGNPYFCKACSTKKQALKQLEEMGVSGGEAVATGKVAPTPNPLMAGLSVTKPEARKIQVKKMPNNLYRETTHGFCVRSDTTRPGTFVCLGVYSADNQSVDPLTDEQREICKSIGLSYIQTDAAPAAPAVTATKTVALPRAGAALPSAGSLKLPGVPKTNPLTLPTASSLPVGGPVEEEEYEEEEEVYEDEE